MNDYLRRISEEQRAKPPEQANAITVLREYRDPEGNALDDDAIGSHLSLKKLRGAGRRLAWLRLAESIVTPIKDSLATKVRATTTRVGGLIYYPLGVGSVAELERIAAELVGWLGGCGSAVTASSVVVLP